MTQSNIIVALDYPDSNAALHMADQLDPARCRLKIGKELFTRSGPDIVKMLQQKGFDIFLDDECAYAWGTGNDVCST